MARTTRLLGVAVPDLEIVAAGQDGGGVADGVLVQGHAEECLGDEDVGGGVGGVDPTDEVLAFYKGRCQVTLLHICELLAFRYALLWHSSVCSEAGNPVWRLRGIGSLLEGVYGNLPRNREGRIYCTISHRSLISISSCVSLMIYYKTLWTSQFTVS